MLRKKGLEKKTGTFSTKQKFGKTALLLVFSIGVLLRLSLALINSEANDNHLAVIKILADENRVPEKDEVLEAFQPKLYHATVALVWKGLPTQSLPIRTRFAQLVCCIAGILTLILALRFLEEGKVSEKVRVYAFSLLALNPDLIGINAQATNDSFVILFVSMALYFGYRFFENRQIPDFCWMTISAVLAGLSKGNGLVVSVAILAVFAVVLVGRGHRFSIEKNQAVIFGSVFFVSVITLLASLGPYGEYYLRYGSPFVNNEPLAPFPKLFEKTPADAPGVLSIADSILTFRLIDMLKNPVITNERDQYPRHRTSLWSQLYGRTHFVHFAAWPRSWQLPIRPELQWLTSLVLNLGRLIFVCALFPTTLFVLALCKRVIASIQDLMKSAHSESDRLSNWLLDLSVFGYIAFVVLYSFRHRNFSLMKAIFIFPAFLGFLMIFMRECEKFYGWCNQIKPIRLCADTTFVLLFVLYTADIVALIAQLSIRLFLYGA